MEKQHTPMWKNNIEIIQDNTNNNTIYNTNIDCNVLPVSKEQVDIPYPTNVEPTKEETRAIDSLNSNSFTLSDLIEEFKKETGATVRKTTIANKTKDLQSRNDIDLDIVRELFKKHLNKNSTSDKPINVIFTGMLKYANDNYDKAVEEEREYQRRKKQEQANLEKELARMNEELGIFEPVQPKSKKVLDISEFVNDDTPQTIDTGIQNETVATESVEFELVYEEEELNDCDSFSYYDEEDKPLSEIEKMFS